MSISLEDVPYPHPVKYMPFTLEVKAHLFVQLAVNRSRIRNCSLFHRVSIIYRLRELIDD
jgi:hypothetical protein